jgi:signal-transduction protein with cAMP-binding, CBS, and nucleotidyltransferase domain/PAS domain-containing protein
MPSRVNKFTYSIVLPTMLAIIMFVVAFYALIIPMFERSMMERKQEMIVELTNASWSVLVEYDQAYKSGELSLAEAQEKAALHIGRMRYGTEQKDYFWIISYAPDMVMHPYRTDLIGKDLSDFTDDHENKLFYDAAQLVKERGAGTTQYYWQWKDDASKIVPKLSYVKGFPEWEWIIGTGIYLDDVTLEIAQMKKRLFTLSFLITLFITLILIYVLRQTRIIEHKRREAEKQLRISIRKYKSLVEASADGTLLVVAGKIAFANSRFFSTLADEEEALIGVEFSSLFEVDWDSLTEKIDNSKKTYSFETRQHNVRPGLENVIIAVTRVLQSGQVGYIVVVKNVTEHKLLDLDAKRLTEDIELSLQLMNQPVHNLVKRNIFCPLGTSISGAVELMAAHQQKHICIKERDEVIGILTESDLKNRVLVRGVALDRAVASVMTSPVKAINQNALLYEAVLMFKQEQVSHLLVEDNIGRIVGYISNLQCLEMQRNSLTYLIQEISECTLIDELRRIYSKVPLLVQAIFTSSDNINSVSRIITSIADAINVRVVDLAIEEIGDAPCAFAFVAMGSEGRGEQTLKTDQDNAIIFEDSAVEVKDYFLKLGEIVNENLHAIGYARCNGDLMAGNPEWCNPLSEWQGYFTRWTDEPEMQNVLDSSIFFDLRLIYGSASLVTQLKQHIEQVLVDNPVFFRQLGKTVIQQKPQIGKKQVDIKTFLVPVVGYLRAQALKYEIPETNSLLRLHQLMAYGLIPDETAEEIENMYRYLMHLRIKWQVSLILDNERPENYVLVKNLTAIDDVTLKKIQQQISRLQDELRTSFKISE